MNKFIDVLSFLQKFKSQEETPFQVQIPLLLFPKLVNLGCSFLTSAGMMKKYANDLAKEIIREKSQIVLG